MDVSQRLYRHTGTALLRAARMPPQAAPEPDHWPDLSNGADVAGWRIWLARVWSHGQTAAAVTLASPSLAARVEEILSGKPVGERAVRRAVLSIVRYLLRETGRPTPFGLFAGVASVRFGPTAKARWGRRHRPATTADMQWLADVIARLEGCPELLERLPVMVNSLRVMRGVRLVLPAAAPVEVRRTSAVQAVERIAARQIRFGALAGALAEEFPTVRSATIRAMITELVQQGFLITSLRAPTTITDPLAHLVDQLHQLRADEVTPVAATAIDLAAIARELETHNQAEAREAGRGPLSAIRLMRRLSQAGRSPVSVDLRLDCDLQLPEQVAREMEAAASVLLRLSTQPGGIQAWRDYYAAFVERYGIGTLVPVMDVVDPDLGLGFPATYPGSLLGPPATPLPAARDERLLALMQQAMMDGTAEILLDEAAIRDLTVGDLDPARIPPHVELAARIHAESLEALDRGEFTLTVTPARAAGTLTGRFTPDASTGQAEVFQHLPTSDADAITAQLSVPPLYPHAENISRTPRFLPHAISLGEHRTADEDDAIGVEDLAITADSQRLRLISVSRRRPVEPQVFHALRLDKQLPTLARFLANLPRSHTATYTELDWGTAAGLPYLPRVRYRRSVLSPARWQLSAGELPDHQTAWATWRHALAGWQHRWRLPNTVELRDGDRTLRLDLTQPTHATLLRLHLDRTGHAVLTEAANPAEHGWLGGHAHQVAVTLVATKPAAPSPVHTHADLVYISNDRYGHLPATPQSSWLFAKVYIHPQRQAEVIAEHMPRLVASIGERRLWWFLRYRSTDEPDHLRLRFQVRDPTDYGTCATTVGAWAAELRRLRISRRLALDTYYPELGRYGDGPTMAAAESVFAADSRVVLSQLQRIPATVAHPVALAVANMVDITCGFAGGIEAGMAWLITHLGDWRPAPAPRTVRDQAMMLADPSDGLAAIHSLAGGRELAAAWAHRRTSLGAYRQKLPSTIDHDAVLVSLLHMHHIRALGIDRDGERVCRRLARSAALGWRTRNRKR